VSFAIEFRFVESQVDTIKSCRVFIEKAEEKYVHRMKSSNTASHYLIFSKQLSKRGLVFFYFFFPRLLQLFSQINCGKTFNFLRVTMTTEQTNLFITAYI